MAINKQKELEVLYQVSDFFKKSLGVWSLKDLSRLFDGIVADIDLLSPSPSASRDCKISLDEFNLLYDSSNCKSKRDTLAVYNFLLERRIGYLEKKNVA